MPKHDEDENIPLLKYLDSLVEELRKLLAPALAGEDTDAVHDARVITRRLKAATSLVKSVVSGRCRKPFDRVGKCVRRQLGPIRDTDVMLEHLSEMKSANRKEAIEWLRQRLEAEREELVKSAAGDAPPTRLLARLGSWWGLRHDIAAAQDRLSDLLAKSVHLQLDAFVEQAQDLAGARNNDPHQLRIAGKSLRYTLEMAREHEMKLPASVVALFKRMQTALGLWHDFVVLAERIMCESVECDLALHRPRLQSELLGVAQLCLRKADVQLSRMGSLWKKQGEWLTQTIRDAFPLTPHHTPAARPEPQPSEPPQDQPAATAPAA